MTLVKCRECKAQVSDKASLCPGCGAPRTPKVGFVEGFGDFCFGVFKLLVIVVGGLFFGAYLLNYGGLRDDLMESRGSRKQPRREKLEEPIADPSGIVANSEWDGSVRQVEQWLESNLRDPDSLEFIEWSKVVKQGDGFAVRAMYRAKNGFGGFEVENKVFVLDRKGNVTGHFSYPP